MIALSVQPELSFYFLGYVGIFEVGQPYQSRIGFVGAVDFLP